MFIIDLYNLVLYQPLYNGLIFIIDVMPWGDAGLAIIVFTVVIRFIIFPLSRKAVQTQMKIREFDSELKAIKEKYAKDKQEQARKMMDFYKEKGINPFSSFLLILIQLPIIITLYQIFFHAGLPEVNQGLLYSFVEAPQVVTTSLLGLAVLTITGKSVILALLAAVTSFFQIKLSIPPLKPKTSNQPNFKEDLSRSMNLQMRYVFPVIIFFISYSISGAIALYLLTSNLFTIAQELVVRREYRQKNGASKEAPAAK